MQAVICTKYGPPEVLQLREVSRPSPRHNEVLVKIRATAATASDIYIRGSQLPLRFKLPMRLALGITKPRNPIIGMVLAGEIEAVGRDIRRYKPGDRVYGVAGLGLGAYAQYTCMKETDSMRGCLALMPANISYEEATTAAYGGLLALQRIEEGRVERGQHVLIYGASGTSGTMAVQFAKYYGAQVTAVCGTRNLAFIRSLGADHVIDYTRDNAADTVKRYDLMLDTAGKAKSSAVKEACRRALRQGAKSISIDDGKLELSSTRLARIKDIIESGAVKPIVDRIFPLERIAEAHAYVEEGHKIGGVAVSVGHGE